MAQSKFCSRCGAPLTFGGENATTCTFCRNENQGATPAGAPPYPPPPYPPPPYPAYGPSPFPPLPRRSSAGPLAVALTVGFLTLLSIGALASFMMMRAGPAPMRTAGSPGTATAVTSTQREELDWGGVLPAFVTINDDPVEDFVGVFRDKGSLIQLGAFNGKTLEPIWKAGPYAKWEGPIYTHVIVKQKRVLLTEPSGKAHLLEVTTGKELAAYRLSDKPDTVCSVPNAPSVWIETTDRNGFLVDMAAPGMQAASRPSSCGLPSDEFDCRRAGLEQGRCRSGSNYDQPGFSGDIILSDGTLHVVLGHKSPGTAVPIIIGTGTTPPAKGTRPLWQRVLGPGDASGQPKPSTWVARFQAGRLYIPYEATEDRWRLVCLDASTGKNLWEVAMPKVPSDPSGVAASPTRVYVTQWSHLFVFDVQSGTSQGMIGSSFWLEK